MNRKVGSIKWNRGISLFLTILLIALPALAQSTQEQEQPENIISDAEQVHTEITLTDAEQGAINGARDGKNNFSALFWGVIAMGAGLLCPTYGLIVETNNSAGNGRTGCVVGFLGTRRTGSGLVIRY